MNNIIHTTGVQSERRHYINMGISEKSAFLYGCNSSQIENITFEVSDDQSPANTELMEYWGWFDNEKQDWSFIFPNYWQLYICFPYGLTAHEKHGDGKAYRLKLI